MKKTVHYSLFTVLLLLFLLAFSSCSDKEGSKGGGISLTPDDIVYTENLSFAPYEDGKEGYMVTGFSDNAGAEELNIPPKYNKKPVIAIDVRAFADHPEIKSVYIPDSVKIIEPSAFSGCLGIESMILPFVGRYLEDADSTPEELFGYIFGQTSYEGAVETWQHCGIAGEETVAFYLPPALKWVSVASGKIHLGAFSSCSTIEKIVLGNGVTAIEEGAFSGCINLSMVYVSGSVREIGQYAFMGCSNLSRIDLCEGIEILHPNSLAHCTALKTLKIPASVMEFSLALVGCDNLQSLSLCANSSLYTLFSENSYYTHPSLKAVVLLGEKVSTGAFSYCDYLQCVTFTESVKTLESGAFQSCLVKSVYIPNLSWLCSLDIKDKYANPLHEGAYLYLKNELVTDLVIPEGVETVNNYAFFGCGSIQSVTFASSTTYIGQNAFGACKRLDSIQFSDSMQYIAEEAFRNCRALDNIALPASLKYIGPYAFYECNSLSSATFAPGISWYGTTQNGTKSPISLGTPAQNAQNLQRDYADYYWQWRTQ